MLPDHRARPGFTLIELSVVLAIVAILTAGAYSLGSSMVESARRVNTNNKLDAIEQALMAFRLANNRLPCPGDATLTDILANASAYGYEAANLGSCIGGTPAANSTATVNSSTAGSTTVAEGAVPVRTLNLPDEFQFDGWGRKIGYAVWTPLTATNAFITYGVNPSCGAITVQNAGHGYRSTAGAYALISYGPDGHGGYLKSGTRLNSGSDNADELTNCHCTSNLTGNPAYAATYVEQEMTQTSFTDPLSVFDDIVRFKERWQMQNAYDTYSPVGSPCLPGFRIDGSTAGEELGGQVLTADVNGDGLPDLIIADNNSSTIYVIFGRSDYSFPDPLPVSSLDGTNGFKIINTTGAHAAIVTTGDFNGDGLTDIAIAGCGSCTNGSGAVIILGQKTWPAVVDASALSNTSNPKGMRIYDVGYYGIQAVAVGDVNGATNTVNGTTYKIDDLILGDGAYNNERGQVDVVFGGTSLPSSLDTSAINGTNGVVITNTAGNYKDYLGQHLAVGDFNGDGIKDIVVGMYEPYVYIIWGHTGAWTSPIEVSTLPANGSVGIQFDCGGWGTGGTNGCGGYFGESLTVDDINNDGIDDLSIGALGARCQDGTNCGAVSTIYGVAGTPGTTSPWNSRSFNLGTAGYGGNLNGTSGFVVEGNWTANDQELGVQLSRGALAGGKSGMCVMEAGYLEGGPYSQNFLFNKSVAGAWPSWLTDTSLNGTNGFRFQNIMGPMAAIADFNSDGNNDYLVSDPTANSNTGQAYLLWGASPMPYASYTPSTFTSAMGVVFNGASSGDSAGTALGAWDANHDGIPEPVICAPHTNYGASDAGSCYVIWGKKAWKTSTINLNTM